MIGCDDVHFLALQLDFCQFGARSDEDERLRNRKGRNSELAWRSQRVRETDVID